MTRTGRSFNSSTVGGFPLRPMLYSVRPIFAVPEGRTTFCLFTGFTTSSGERAFESSFWESMSTIDLPHFPAVRNGDRGSLNGGQLRANEVQTQVVQLLFWETLPAQTQLQDGDGRSAPFEVA